MLFNTKGSIHRHLYAMQVELSDNNILQNANKLELMALHQWITGENDMICLGFMLEWNKK